MAEQSYRVNTEEIAAEVVGGEAMILNLSSGVYYSLDGAGGLAWAMLARGYPLDEVTGAVAEHYEVEHGTAAADLGALRDSLLAEGLLAANPEPGGKEEVAADELPPPGEYRAPQLESFHDMGDLLALDPPMPGMKEVPWQSPQG